MSQPLHVKYRPRSFDEVMGQKHIIDALKQVVKKRRAKAFLFTGPSGCGKTTVARILANEFADGQATAANIVEINAASQTGVDDTRELTNSIHFRAIGKCPIKAIILDEVHRLSGNAFDQLLKPIEEPPSHVYWMLCSTNPGKIPKTVQTRVMRFELKALDENELLTLLKRVVKSEKLELDDEVLEAISEQSNGSPRQALVYLESCQNCESAADANKIMRTAGDTPEIVALCRWLVTGRNYSWTEAMRVLTPLLATTDAESIRLVVLAYVSVVLRNAKNVRDVQRLLNMLEAFGQPYNQSEKEAPLLVSIALAIGIGEK